VLLLIIDHTPTTPTLTIPPSAQRTTDHNSNPIRR
jgi:hypothetical protein